MGFKSGFISIVGRPNVGKSTLLNNILGRKVAIMSPKAQTTRNQIRGVYTTEEEQVVFIDTPGIHKPKHKLGKFMTDIAINTFNQVDLICFMVNAGEDLGAGDKYIIELLKNQKTPVILLINQIDKLNSEEIALKIVQYKDLYDFDEIVPMSALKGRNVERFKEVISSYLEEGPKFYPSDYVTDHPERFIIAEYIREKILLNTEEEVPHSIAVQIENLSRDEKGNVDITAIIIVERESQKGIIIGKGGKMLKKVGTMARKDIQNLLGSKIYLETFVKVEKNWRNRNKHLTEFGYNKNEY